ncbi:MAG: hypothetical protein LBE09_03465 [Christensenellaceae bacterium]|nr:hypothetical protein [Christensenellaceae bacterium]
MRKRMRAVSIALFMPCATLCPIFALESNQSHTLQGIAAAALQSSNDVYAQIDSKHRSEKSYKSVQIDQNLLYSPYVQHSTMSIYLIVNLAKNLSQPPIQFFGA